MAHKTPWGTGVLRSLGLVFGDIGTSPIYTLTVVVAGSPAGLRGFFRNP